MLRDIGKALGQRVLDVYKSMECGSSTHTLYLVFGIGGTLVYMVGFPLSAIFFDISEHADGRTPMGLVGHLEG